MKDRTNDENFKVNQIFPPGKLIPNTGCFLEAAENERFSALSS